MKETFHLEISWHTLWRVIVFGVMMWALYLSREVLGVLFASIVISLGLDPVVSYLERKGIGRILGTLFVFVGVFIVLVISAYFVIPIFTVEASSFLKQFHDFSSAIFGIGFPDNIVDAFTFGRERLFDYLLTVDVSVAEALTRFLTSTMLVIVTVLTTFYLSVEKNGTERLLRVILPDRYEAPVLSVFERFKTKIRRWMAAQLTLSVIIGIVVGIGLWLLGVRHVFVLGVLAAIFEIVPVIGPIIVGIIAFLVAVSDSFVLGVYAIIFFFLVQQLENHLLVPVVMGKSMKVHPVVVIMSLLAGGKIAGLLGIILAVPIAVIVQETFEYIAEKKDKRTYLV
jgi:predicted PurR-regulated permease PerM